MNNITEGENMTEKSNTINTNNNKAETRMTTGILKWFCQALDRETTQLNQKQTSVLVLHLIVHHLSVV